MTNVGWVVYGRDIDQPKLVILTNLFLSAVREALGTTSELNLRHLELESNIVPRGLSEPSIGTQLRQGT